MSAEDLANSMDFELIPDEPETTQEIAQEAAPETPAETGEQSTPPVEDKPEHEPQMVPLAAKQAEKEKRQEAERKLEYLQSQIEAQQRAQQQKTEETEKPDPWNDLEGTLKAQQQEYEQKLAQQRQWFMEREIAKSEEQVKSEHTDFDEVMDHYEEMVKKNPSLYAESMQTLSPAQHAYNMAKNDKELREMGSREELEKKIREQVLAELKANKPIPPDLTTVRSSSSSDYKADDVIDFTKNLNDFL